MATWREFSDCKGGLAPILRLTVLELNLRVRLVDALNMITNELLDITDETACLTLLSHYANVQSKSKAEQPEFTGWLPRVTEFENLERGDLSRMHGQLIALGYLKFQLGNRHSGMEYQVSPEGVRAAASAPVVKTESETGTVEQADAEHAAEVLVENE